MLSGRFTCTLGDLEEDASPKNFVFEAMETRPYRAAEAASRGPDPHLPAGGFEDFKLEPDALLRAATASAEAMRRVAGRHGSEPA